MKNCQFCQLRRPAEEELCQICGAAEFDPSVEGPPADFGLRLIGENRLAAAYEYLEGLVARGVDCHIGSQLTDARPLREAITKVSDLYAQLRAQGFQAAQAQFHLHAAFAAQQFVPLVGDEPIEVLEEVRVALGGQQHVQAFGRGDEQLGQGLLLRRAFLGTGVSGARAHLPIQLHTIAHPLGALRDLAGQGAQRGDPKGAQAPGIRTVQ